MATICIAAILVAIGAPAMSGAMNRHEARSVRNELAASFHLAEIEAALRGNPGGAPNVRPEIRRARGRRA
jgi:Tfp pilus assembly protein FimT